MSVKRSNFTLVFFKAGCYANLGAEIKFVGSSSCTLRHLLLKYSNTSATNNWLLWRSKPWYSPKFFIAQSILLRTLF